ncbi:MAG: hypothetical protein ACREVY_03690 [Gammaproteobacteria bacterium]
MIAYDRSRSMYLLAAIFCLVLVLNMTSFAQESLSLTLADSVVGATCVSPQVASLDIGFTLTHETVDTEAEDACTEKQGGGASVDGVNNIVRHYDDPALRGRVQSLLRKMATDGARAMRTIVWFRHAEDAEMAARPKDPLGLLIATDGKLDSNEVSNIVNYVSDARDLGYRRFFVVVGPQGTSNPKCRKGGVWGACYNERFLQQSWSVISQVVTALHTPQLSKIEVIVDLSSENCADSLSKMPVYRNMTNYTRYMLARYRERFDDHQFIASCGTGSEKVIFPTLASQENLFRELGMRPASVDVHIYETDQRIIRQLLITANATARRLGVPLDILETYYDHPNIFRIVSDMKSANQLASLRDILVWPRRVRSACQIDVRAPYAMNRFDTELGRRTPEGRILPTCQ